MDAEKLLSHATFEQIWTPFQPENDCASRYGFGWYICNLDSGHRLLCHGGGWQGFSAYIARYPDDHLTVVALCNLRDAETGYIAEHIASFYIPALASPVRFKAQTR